MRYLLLLASCLMVAIPLKGQQAQKPTPPYLAPLPENGHWIVTFSYIQKTDSGTAPTPAPKGYPSSVETIKVGNSRRIIVKSADGTSEQFDVFGALCFAQTPAGLECRKLDETYTPYMFFNLGFSFTQCVNPGAFKETTSLESVPVFHYVDDTSEAWISVETRLPIAADLINSVKTSYHYLPKPDSGDVAMTPAEQKLLLYRKQGAEIYNNMR